MRIFKDKALWKISGINWVKTREELGGGGDWTLYIFITSDLHYSNSIKENEANRTHKNSVRQEIHIKCC